VGVVYDTADRGWIVSIKLFTNNFLFNYTADHKSVEFIVKYLGEFESIFKKALTRGSGAQLELFNEKIPEVENLVTLSL
jgi:hypothetical protein